MVTAAPMVVIAIPVCNEVARIGACLRAISGQVAGNADRVVLLLNNCTDGTLAAVRDLEPQIDVRCEVIARELQGAEASAGAARSLALRHAACRLAPDDILLTTDADARVAPDWVGRNLLALRRGADAVCGRAILDPADAACIPAHLHADDARECRLGAMLDEISWRLDPDPFDPWPRHTEHAGASIAVTVAAWRRAGGMRPVPTGEDRAFVTALRRVDARIRHDPGVLVTVSGRTEGRAIGGMADTIRRRILEQDEFTDAAIEPAADRVRRMRLRASARRIWSVAGDASGLAAPLHTPAALVREAMSRSHFGAAWEALESVSPVLLQRRVRFADLPAEIEAAATELAALRRVAAPSRVAMVSV